MFENKDITNGNAYILIKFELIAVKYLTEMAYLIVISRYSFIIKHSLCVDKSERTNVFIFSCGSLVSDVFRPIQCGVSMISKHFC